VQSVEKGAVSRGLRSFPWGVQHQDTRCLVDGLGNPFAYRLTGDEAPDVKPAYELLSGLSAERVIADKAYDADDLLKQIQMV